MANVYVVGAQGRMGQLVCDMVSTDEELTLAGAYDVHNIEALDADAPAADLVIDFSRPEAIGHVANFVRRTGAAYVCGTTGVTEDDLATLEALGSDARVVWSSNYSLGVAVLRRVAAEAARALEGWDVEIVETHHNKKADAPSGTALALVASVDPEGSCEVCHGREGLVGERPARQIGVHAVRGGTVAGTHEVHFFGADEEVCCTHRATSRQIFVAGAVACAKRLLAADPGFYTFDQLMFS